MTGIRPLNRNQQLENRAFLRALARSGNALQAAREVGVKDSTMIYRRKRHPDFALRWGAAMTAAAARLHRKGAHSADGGSSHRTAGGEPTITRLKSGRLQVRAARRGALTKQCEQAFLLALSASANVSLSAAAAGASVAAFNKRRRRDPGFAREMRAALAAGYARLEEAVIAGFLPENHADDAWRHNDAPALPRVTAQQALQLLYLHQKRVTAPWSAIERGPRGLPEPLWRARVMAEYAERCKQAAEDGLTAALARAAAGLTPSRHETPVALPSLDQAAASKADPAKGGHSPRALFGGWRIEHLSPAQRAAGRAKARRGR